MAKKKNNNVMLFVIIGIVLVGGYFLYGGGTDGDNSGTGSIGYDDINKDIKTFTLDKSWSGFALIDARPDRCYSIGGVSESNYKCYMSVVNNFVWAIPSSAPDSFVGGKITCTCLEK